MSAAAAVLRNCRRVSDGRLEKGIEFALASQVAAQLSIFGNCASLTPHANSKIRKKRK